MRINVDTVEGERWYAIRVSEQWLVIPCYKFTVDNYNLWTVIRSIFHQIASQETTYRASSKLSKMRRSASFAGVTLPTRWSIR